MVDSQSGNDGTRDREAPGDPLLMFAAALRDLYLLGSSAVENALSEKNLNSASETLGPALDPILRAALAFRELAARGVGYDASGAAGVASIAAQAYLVAATSGFRYLRRVAQIYGMHQSSVLQSLLGKLDGSNVSDEERRDLIEEIRTYLREVGDVSLQEARIFQSELEKLAAEVADVAGDDATGHPSTHRRRWKAKQ